MNRKFDINQERVTAAADAIRDSGEVATADRVRDAIGGGSKSTILPFLKRWREAQVGVVGDPSFLNVPAISRAINGLVEEKVQLAVGAYKKTIEAMESDIESLTHDNCMQQDEVHQLRQEKVELEELRLVDLKKLDRMEIEHSNANKRIAELSALQDSTKTALDRCLLRLEEVSILHKEIASLRGKEKAASELAAELKGRLLEINGQRTLAQERV